MFTIYTVYSVLIAVSCCMISTAREPAKLREEVHPTSIVEIAHGLAASKGIRPTSLLLLELGSVLTQGSFLTYAHLLSLRPAKLAGPVSQFDVSVRASGTQPHGYIIHTILWQALAAPLSIIAVVSEEDISRNTEYFQTDFIQNIRHKFVCVILTRTGSQHKRYPMAQSTYPVSTVAVVRRKGLDTRCLENRDNLFRLQVRKSIQACDSTARSCEFKSFRVLLQRATHADLVLYKLRVKCNATEVDVDHRTTHLGRSTHSNIYVSMSRYNLGETRLTDCYSYIPFSDVDVKALAKPFSAGVWCLTLTTVIVLTTAWSLIKRESALEFSSNVVLSLITVRELQSASTSCRGSSGTIIECATLAFIFFIGQIYSNCVMSSFLDPTGEVLQWLSAFDCTTLPTCQYESSLDFLLTRSALCHIVPSMLIKVKKPLRRFVPLKSFSEPRALFRLLFTELYPRNGVVPLPLVPTQPSVIWIHIIEHGILSPRKLALIEQNIVAKSHFDSIEYSRMDKVHLSDVKRWFAKIASEETHLLSFEIVREWFDMTSLWKLQPVFLVCMLLIIAGIGLEVSGAKGVLVISAFLRALSSSLLVRVTFIRQVCAKLLGELLRCLAISRGGASLYVRKLARKLCSRP